MEKDEEKEKKQAEKAAEGSLSGGEPNAPQSRRESFIAGVRERMGEDADKIDWEDPEARYGAYSDEYGRLNDELSRFRESDGKLREAIGQDERFGDVMADIASGGDAAMAFIKAYGRDLTEMMADESRKSDVEAANNEYLEKLKRFESATHMDEVRADLFEKNSAAIDDFCKNHNLDENGFTEFCQGIFDFAGAVYMGNLDAETLDKGWKLFRYDENISKAKEEGVAMGKNESLEKSKVRKKGDGLPDLGHLSGIPPKKKPLKGGSFWD